MTMQRGPPVRRGVDQVGGDGDIVIRADELMRHADKGELVLPNELHAGYAVRK